jgi:hypothetical protein
MLDFPSLVSICLYFVLGDSNKQLGHLKKIQGIGGLFGIFLYTLNPVAPFIFSSVLACSLVAIAMPF